MTNTENAVVRPVTTNNVGQHLAPDVHLGHYTAHTEAAGFKVAEQKDINVNVGVSGSLYVVDSGEDGGSGIISIMPSFDSIAESRAPTSKYGAEYGLSPAATTTIQFNSGTKSLLFHTKMNSYIIATQQATKLPVWSK